MHSRESKLQNIRVYTGPGSSNSWVWLADFLEKYGFLRSCFISDPREISSTLREGDVLVVPGGDTFRMADSFGEKGLAKIAAAIDKGANYIGICAGAYLPLRSSIPPLSSFNLLDAKIANISSELPENIVDSERYSVRYGCSYVFHPARGAMVLDGERDLVAPLYGGPMLIPSAKEKVLLSFKGLSEDAEILMDKGYCLRTIVRRAACIEGRYGEGRVICVAPHLEHPDFPDANGYFDSLLRGFDSLDGDRSDRQDGTGSLDELRRIIADLRVQANALGDEPWKIGIKYWEGEKLLFFIEAVRRRIRRLHSTHDGFSLSKESVCSFDLAKRKLSEFNSNGEPKDLEEAIDCLSRGTSIFLNDHFAMIRGRPICSGSTG